MFFDQTHSILEKSKEYKDYDAKQKLQSFYFTFFELLSANRSYVVLKLKSNKNKMETLKQMQLLKKAYAKYINKLSIKKIDFKNDKANDLQDKSMANIAWLQLLSVIKFWLEDSSKKFEKTDIYIEKSIKASFDLIDISAIKSVLDLAKFIWNEKKEMA